MPFFVCTFAPYARSRRIHLPPSPFPPPLNNNNHHAAAFNNNNSTRSWPRCTEHQPTCNRKAREVEGAQRGAGGGAGAVGGAAIPLLSSRVLFSLFLSPSLPTGCFPLLVNFSSPAAAGPPPAAERRRCLRAAPRPRWGAGWRLAGGLAAFANNNLSLIFIPTAQPCRLGPVPSACAQAGCAAQQSNTKRRGTGGRLVLRDALGPIHRHHHSTETHATPRGLSGPAAGPHPPSSAEPLSPLFLLSPISLGRAPLP